MYRLITTAQRADALLALLFGLGFVLAPGLLLALYGVDPDPARLFLARMLGAAVLGYAWINWVSGTTASEELRWAVVASELAFDVLSVPLVVIAVGGGVLNAFGWPLVAIFAVLLAVRAAYLLSRTGSDRDQH